jgi:hypothetical protein
MTKAMVAGMLALGLAACATDGAKEAQAVPIERSLASGTRVKATIQDAMSSQTNKAGQTLHAIVSGDVKGPRGGVVIPAGSSATLTIVQLDPGTDAVRPEGRLSLVVSSVTVNGQDYPVTADLDPVPHHLQGRSVTPAVRAVYRDVVVSPGTPIAFALTNSLNVPAR